ncbi:MAG: hypothetical protein ACI4N3_02320 [Alphaproteobacteria bacterium]
MKVLYNKFNKLEDENVINMFTGFFDLFLKSPSSYTLLSDLIDIYNSDVLALNTYTYDKDIVENDEKIEVLMKSFDIFNHLLNRDEILEDIIRNERVYLPKMLLNDDLLLFHIIQNPQLLAVNKKREVMNKIFPQLKNKQR